MKNISAFFRSLDWIFIGAISIVFCIGLLTLYGDVGDRVSFYKQAVFGFAALVAMLGMSAIDYRVFREYTAALVIIYSAGVAFLAALIFFGTQTRGVVSWFWFGPVGLQPVEFMKVILVLVLAKYLSKRHVELYKLRHLVVPGLYALIPAALVLLQPDLGSAIVLVAVWVGMVSISGIKLKQFFGIVLAGVIVAGLLWSFGLQDYQQARVLSFMYPERDMLGGAYQTRQALIAIGSGGLFGKGLGEGTQTRLGFLPEYKTDFMFAAIAEEWGFVGALIILLLWAAIFWRLYVIWERAPGSFARLIVGGAAVLFLTHVVVNIGANLGMLPVTGLPLPFISAGGSNLIAFAVMAGIVLNVARNATIPRVTDDLV